MQKISIKWLIAHDPERLFVRTAKAFTDALSSRIGNTVDVEVLTISSYEQKYGKPQKDLLNLLNDGDVQMTQTEVGYFGHWNKNFMVLDLPYLFRDHDHCTRVLEGRIGQAMCANLAKHSNMRGLAFTYSGGYRVIGSNEPITSLKNLRNLRVLTGSNPILSDALSTVCGETKFHGTVTTNYGYATIEQGLADATETTYIRFQGKHVLKTNHSMFLTTIAINDKFLQSLDSHVQVAVAEAAVEAGRLEREWSIQEAAEFETNCATNGVTITEFDADDAVEFEKSVTSIYSKWNNEFLPGMVEHIRLQ